MWGLTINSDKSKVMVFSKVGRTKTDKFNFVINSSAVDYVTSYKYLGINISNTGKFALAEKNLSLKASRALFSVKQSVFNNNVKPSVIFRIFDSLVKPIALYGSDVWFGYKKNVFTINHLMKFLKCHLKAIMNSIRFIQDFVNLY